MYLKAIFESGRSYFNFKRLIPGGFNKGFIGSTCTAGPYLGLYVAPVVLEGAHVRLSALASLLGGHAVPQQALQPLALLVVVLCVVVLGLGDLVRRGLPISIRDSCVAVAVRVRIVI